MLKIKVHFFPLLLLVLSYSSCTVEKRVYSSGYHIEWNNSNRLAKKELGNANKAKSQIVTAEESEIVSSVHHHSVEEIDQKMIASADYEPIVNDKKENSNLAPIRNSALDKQETTLDPSIIANSKTEKYTLSENSVENPQKNKMALASFISAILAILYVGVIPSLLLGAIALSQFKKNPGKYKNKWMATTGVVIGYIGCSAGILFSLAATIFGGPMWLILGVILLANIIVSSVILLTKE